MAKGRAIRLALGRAVPIVVGGALVAFFWLAHLRLALDKRYSIDEFQYAHGAWRIAQGEVPYRDFFEHHHPLIHQLMAGVFLAAGDEDPNNLIYLRLAMLPFLVLTLVAAWGVNARGAGRFGLVTPLLVLMVPSYSLMAVEVRPDPLAFSLFLSALAVLYAGRLDRRLRGAVAGLLFVAALWGTQKAAYYGLVFPAALAADLTALRRRRESFLTGHPWAFLAGCGAAALPIAVYLTWTSSWGAWLEWCVRWSFVHQAHYPGFFWTRNFTQLLAQSFWLFPLAAVGAAGTVRARPGAGSPDWLLLGAAVTSLASFAWQTAAYLYSLVPFTVMLAVFAGRGLVSAVRWAGRGHGVAVFAAALLALVVAVELQRSRTALDNLLADDNEAQHERLARLHALTRPDEPVLEIAGGQITRPSVHFFYFFEAVVRQLQHDVFAYELPRAMVERGCVAYMPDVRFGRLPEPLRRFLLERYQPYDRGLWFWGSRYRVPATRELEAPFLAVRDGRYFVWPLSAAAAGDLAIDERPVAGPVFELAAGDHRVSYRGEEAELFLLWLPADGRPFEPRPELQPDLEPGS